MGGVHDAKPQKIFDETADAPPAHRTTGSRELPMGLVHAGQEPDGGALRFGRARCEGSGYGPVPPSERGAKPWPSW